MGATNLGSTTTTKITNYPLNAWYVVAWDYEVVRKPIARTVGDTLWSRSFSGTSVGHRLLKTNAPELARVAPEHSFRWMSYFLPDKTGSATSSFM